MGLPLGSHPNWGWGLEVCGDLLCMQRDPHPHLLQQCCFNYSLKFREDMSDLLNLEYEFQEG